MTLDREKLLAVIQATPEECGYAGLEQAYRAAYGITDPIPLARVHDMVYRLRSAGRTVWGSGDARLSEAALTTRLLRNAGGSFREYKQHTLLQYLRQYDRLLNELPTRIPQGTLERWAARLRAERKVVNLRSDGEPYLDDARPGEDLIVGPRNGGAGNASRHALAFLTSNSLACAFG